MNLKPFVTGEELIRCGCCKEFILDVAPQETPFLTMQAYPERVDRELGELVCESCWKGLRNGKAWLVAAGLPKVTQAGDER